jgi:hypothetical protein
VSPPIEPEALKPWKQKFRRAWPKLIDEDRLALWEEHVETP